MEHIQKPYSVDRQKTQFSLDSSDSSHLKAELMLLQRKFERLAQKERRLQVGSRSCGVWWLKEDTTGLMTMLIKRRTVWANARVKWTADGFCILCPAGTVQGMGKQEARGEAV